MDDLGAVQGTGAGTFSGIDNRLLQHLATSILTAHAANPRCWALSRTTVGSIPLHIHATVVLTLRKGGGDFYGLGDPNAIPAEDLRVLARQDGRDRFVLGSIGSNQFDVAYTSLRAEHDALIANRAPAVKTRAMRADHHEQALVEELSLVLGLELPEPDYLLEDHAREARSNEAATQVQRLPSNYDALSDEVKAIYDALTDEGMAAVNALPDELFIDAEGNDCSGIFLDSILRAHERAPESWSLVSYGEDVSAFYALNIQNKNIATLWRKQLTVVAQRDAVDMLAIDANMTGKVDELNAKPERSTVTVPIDLSIPPPVREEFLDAHHQLIDRLARGRNGIMAKNHRDDIRVKLALVTNSVVPAPGYVPPSTLGQPFGLRTVARTAEGQPRSNGGDPEPRRETGKTGQAIYDTLTDEGKAAVDALPDDIFTDPEGVDRSRWFLESLRLAHAGSPACWALMGGPGAMGGHGSMLLTIGTKNVISMRDKMRFVVFRDLVREDKLDGGFQHYISYDAYKFRDDIVQVEVDLQTPAGALSELERAHRQTIIRLATGKIGSQGRNHKDDARVKLALLTDEYVPAPAYLPESTYGLPNGLRLVARAEGETVALVQGGPATKELGVPLDVPTMVPKAFAVAGLTYTDAQVASFYTALQTKGFVILSGISGTGKSKIAQRFADMLPAAMHKQEGSGHPIPRVSAFPRDSRLHEATRKRLNIKRDRFSTLEIPESGDRWPLSVRIGDHDGEGMIVTVTKADESRHTDIELPPHLLPAFQSLVAGAAQFGVGLYGTEPGPIQAVVLAPTPSELPETYVSSGEEEYRSPTHLFLPVRPDWRDGKALIGYHNPLTGEYVRTGFLDFVIAAADDYRAGNRNAFFVILDEMNLAHVEYYFADVLSVIESGRDAEGWTVEGIPLAVGEEDADLPERLHLPPNLYIVGTVNMDETTHPFSPKVLDRAFTIELTEVDFSAYPPGDVAGESDLEEAERHALLEAFTRNGRYPRIDKDDIRGVVADHPRFRADLASLNTSLKRYRMHFGYRVFDEIMQFVHNAETNGLFSPEDAFDHAVLMKVLPKFNGSRAKLERALLELILWSRQRVQATEDEAREIVAGFENYLTAGKAFDTQVENSDDWRYPATGRRAALMMQDLYTDGFAAFG